MPGASAPFSFHGRGSPPPLRGRPWDPSRPPAPVSRRAAPDRRRRPRGATRHGRDRHHPMMSLSMRLCSSLRECFGELFQKSKKGERNDRGCASCELRGRGERARRRSFGPVVPFLDSFCTPDPKAPSLRDGWDRPDRRSEPARATRPPGGSLPIPGAPTSQGASLVERRACARDDRSRPRPWRTATTTTTARR